MRHFQENEWKSHLDKEEICSKLRKRRGEGIEEAEGFEVEWTVANGGYGVLQHIGPIF